MALLDKIIGVIVPHTCVGCGREPELLCDVCCRHLRPGPACCYRCQRSSADSATCADCLLLSCLTRVQAAAAYTGLAKDLVWKFKFAHAQAAADEMAALMRPLYANVPRGALLVVPIPTATGHVRQRGFDQARLLARALARQLGQPYAAILARQGQTRQLGTGRRRRLQQLNGTFRLRKPARLLRPVQLFGSQRRHEGRHILLVDDVITTGATLEAAARCLRAGGARHISAAVFAQTPAPSLNANPLNDLDYTI